MSPPLGQWSRHLIFGSVKMFVLNFAFYVGPERVWLCENISDDNKRDDGEGDADYCAHDDVKRMMEVVADPRQTHPEAQDHHPELEEGPENLQGPHKPPEAAVINPRERVETGLKVDDEKHPAEKAEARVSGEE